MEQLERDSCGFLSDSGFAVAEMTPAAFLLDQWELFFSLCFYKYGRAGGPCGRGAAVMESVICAQSSNAAFLY